MGMICWSPTLGETNPCDAIEENSQKRTFLTSLLGTSSDPNN